jgi:ribulose-phosphate 3-epimerase
MDGHFVPNLTFGPQMVAELRSATPSLFFDVHLMLDAPHHFIKPFAAAGSQLISVHIEPALDHRAIIQDIHDLGCQAGIVLNPGTPAESVKHLLDQVELVLVMTVQPGFGGQAFRRDMLPKLSQLSAWRSEQNLKFRLEVDGGVDLKTGPECRTAGADTFVAGTAFFKAEDRTDFVRKVSAW